MDHLIKGHFKGLNIAFSCASVAQTVNDIVIRHNCSPVSAHILGRSLTCSLLSAAVLPLEHRINVCWKYKGLLRTVVVDAGQDGAVRGFVSPAQIDFSDRDLNALYGDLGDLQTVVSHKGKVINSGTAPVSLQDVAKDLAYYHCISDQVETGITALISFNADPENPIQICQGWMIQALPNCDLTLFDRVRNRLESPEFRALISNSLLTDDLSKASSILTEGETGFEGVYSETASTPRFSCTCSKEKMEAVLRTIPIPERMELVKENKPVEIRCQFCNRLHTLSIEECIAAWNRKTG
jgi:molecular chaperone Hsp33